MSGNSTETITLEILAKDLASGNISKFVAGMDEMAKQGGIVGGIFQGIGQSIGQFLNPMELGLKAFEKVKEVIGEAYNAAAKEQAAMDQLGQSVQDNATDMDAWKQKVEAATNAGAGLGFMITDQDDALRGLVARTHDVSQAIDLLTLSENLARFKNMDLAAAAGLVGKAYSGQVGALRRAGIAIDKNATAAQALDAIQKATAGQAAIYAKTAEGSQQRVNATYDAAMAKLGQGLLPLMTTFADVVGKIAGTESDANSKVLDLTAHLQDQAEKLAQTRGPSQDFIGSLLQFIDLSDHANDAIALLGNNVYQQGVILRNEYQPALGGTTEDYARLAAAAKESGTSFDDLRASLDKQVAAQEKASAAAKDGTQNSWDQSAAAKAVGQDYETMAKQVELAAAWQAKALNNIAVSAKSMLDDVEKDAKQAQKDLTWTIHNAGKLAAEQAKIQKQISGEMRRGLASDNTFVQNQVATNVSTLIGDLGKLQGVAVDTGQVLQWVIDVMNGTNTAKSNAMEQLANLYAQLPKPGGSRPPKHHASGGVIDSGEWGWVGENGPELVRNVGPHGVEVVPTNRLSAGGGGSALEFHMHWHSTFPPSPVEAQRIAQAMGPAMRDEFRRQGLLAPR